MKILLVTPFNLEHPGGINDHVLHLDKELQRQGLETRILAPHSRSDDAVDDGHVYRLGRTLPLPANGSTAWITLSPFISGKVKQFLRREAVDVVHVHEPLVPTLSLLVLRHSQAVNVGTFHSSRATHTGYNMMYIGLRPIVASFFKKLHGWTAVSPTVQEFIHQYFPADYEIIPNGIDIQRFGPSVEPARRHVEDGPTILFVGRFNEARKGLKYLLRALATVRQRFPTCRLRVVGPGDQQRVESLLADYQLNNVEFVGPVSAQNLPSYYAACDLFCAPSTGQESFGIVLLEAMASGKPVVATNIAGYSAVVRNGVEGVLVNPSDADALAAALIMVLSDAEMRVRFGHAGRRRAEEHAWPVVTKRVVATYEAAISRKNSREKE